MPVFEITRQELWGLIHENRQERRKLRYIYKSMRLKRVRLLRRIARDIAEVNNSSTVL